jgi:hypothetical protein
MNFSAGIIVAALTLLLLRARVDAALLPDQWAALMDVYATETCPRFNATEPCPTSTRTGVDVRLNCNATHVLHLNFAQQRLDGVLSSQIGKLTGLTRLDIYDNKNLRGTIPDTIRQLSKLTFLALASNREMTGTIPDLSTLTDATDIHLWGNRLEGTISPVFARLSALRVLLLHENEHLRRTIPSEFAQPAGKWQDLRIHQNRLSGIVPAMPTISNCFVAFYRSDRIERNCFANCPLSGQNCNCSISDSLIRRCASNDECGSRTPVPADGIVNAAFATASCPLDGGCASDTSKSGSNDVWYTWNATCSGRAYADACATQSPYERAAVAVYADGCPSALESCEGWTAHSVCSTFAANSVCRLAKERAEFNVVAGQQVALRVYALNNSPLFSAKLNIGCTPIDCAGEVGGPAKYDRCGVCRGPTDTTPCELSETSATPTASCPQTCPQIECSDRTVGWIGNACKALRNGARSVIAPCIAGQCDTNVSSCNVADLGVLHTCVDVECVRTTECQRGERTPSSIATLCMTDGEDCGAGKRCTTNGKCDFVSSAVAPAVIPAVAAVIALLSHLLLL